ncbi:MAG: hypothetical protein LBT93_07400 [Treponema sp.]|jgi:hypothetical protein|nr:hypothetical protein [Treponema sp.]
MGFFLGKICRGPKNMVLLLFFVLFLSGLSCAREGALTADIETGGLFPLEGGRSSGEGEKTGGEEMPAGTGIPGEETPGGVLPDLATRDAIAEIERSGGFTRGLGLTESVLRENAGDYGGAVIAAYKELAWLYGYGAADRNALVEGLEQVLAFYQEDGAIRAARGVLAFLAGEWAEAELFLGPLFSGEEEPDAFSQWMLMVCALEGGEDSRSKRMVYGAIRARYAAFPEYWYRGARCFSGDTAAEYAERCINLAPQGPFAEECRTILAVHAGLSPQDGGAIRSGAEIDYIISQSVSSDNPELLKELFPLISLPDNPYTLYASGALRALAASEPFKTYFTAGLRQSSGRLAERLLYISRG